MTTTKGVACGAGLARRRRGVGPGRGRLRDAVRAEQLPRVRRRPPPTEGRRRRPAARRRLRFRAGHRARRAPRRPLCRDRRRRPARRRRAGPLPRRRHPGRGHARRCRGTRRRSTWSRASAACGAPRRTRCARSTACSPPAAGSGSRCGATSRSRPARGRSRRSGWPTSPPSRTRRRWSRWAGRARVSSSWRGHGFVDVQRVDVPVRVGVRRPADLRARHWPRLGPAYEAIRTVGEQAFHDAAVRVAEERVRAGLPLRADIAVTGYLARKP